MTDPLLYVAAGLLVGILVGLTGVGGGSLMTPILVLVFGQSPAVAVGTDLVFAAATKVAATASFSYSRRIDWRIVGQLALGSIPGTLAVIAILWSMRRAPEGVDHLIRQGLATMLILTALGLLAQQLAAVFQRGAPPADPAGEHGGGTRMALTVATGLALGVAVTLTSVGAGAIGAVALLFLYPTRLRGERLVATDIAHALPVTLIAGIGHAGLGHLNLPMLGYLLLGSIPGVLAASRLAIRLPPRLSRILLSAALGLVGIRMLIT
jgi:uncharacterized membrane protein YfcA